MLNLMLIKVTLVVLGLFCVVKFIQAYRQEDKEILTKKDMVTTSAIGFVANFFDTFGIGSFASIVALKQIFRLMPSDIKLTGTMNAQAVIPTMLQALLFLQLVKIDWITLIVAVVMISFGAILSGNLIHKIQLKTVHAVMLVGFIATAIIVLLNQLHLMNVGGDLTMLRGYKLAILGLVMFVAGLLPAFGIGFYSLVIVAVFLLGLSPIIAFPIMTTASSIQMPMTALSFIKSRKIYFKSAVLLMVFGSIAVIVAAQLVSIIDSYYLKWLLLIILVFNIYIILKKLHTESKLSSIIV